MNMFGRDYRKLYQLQDKFLSWWVELGLPFYLTVGTALSRFYLNHRFSEDLDFFANADDAYNSHISRLYKEIKKRFDVDTEKSLFNKDFTRIFINESGSLLKVELVNDVEIYIGQQAEYEFGKIDTPLNILTNKITALVSRDEPKDVFDIIHIALNYSFNWVEMFNYAKTKMVINEIDIENRINTFPVSLLSTIDWFIEQPAVEYVQRLLGQISADFILGKKNSLGVGLLPIELAKPSLHTY